MEAPTSPTPSNISLDEWDLISDHTSSGCLSPTPLSTAGGYDSDEDAIAQRDHLSGLVLDVHTGDELDSADEDETVGDAILRESDRRVEAALASSLSSTLDPFRQPLPDYISESVTSSAGSSGLILSFPDPLTPSQEIQARAHAANTDNNLGDQLSEPSLVEGSDTYHEAIDFRPKLTDEGVPTPVLAPVTTDAAEAKEVFLSCKDANDLRKIASYIPRRTSDVITRRDKRLSSRTVVQLFNGPSISQTWSTSIIISILAIVLGSTLFAMRTYTKTAVANKDILSTPTIAGPEYTAGITSAQYHTPELTPTFLLQQTPGAGPSTPSIAVPRSAPLASKTGGTLVPATKLKAASSLGSHVFGTTRLGCVTPVAPSHSTFWSNGKGKGKEKEVVDLHDQFDHTARTQISTENGGPLLLEGPRPMLTLTRLGRDALKGIKAAVHQRAVMSSTDLLALPSFGFDFEAMLDELIARIIAQTTSLLQEISSAMTHQAVAILSSPPIQSAREAFVKHHSRVRLNTRRFTRQARRHHRRARQNARTCSKTVEDTLKTVRRDVVLRNIVTEMKAHHARVRVNAEKGRQIMGDGLRVCHRLLADALGMPAAR